MIPRHMGQVQNQYALYLLYTRLFAGQYVLAGHHQPTDGGGWTGWAIKCIRTFERDWVHKGGVAGVTGGRAAAT